MARAPRMKTVERGRLSGQGITITEAKNALNGMIDDALRGPYEPTLLTHGSYTAIAFRTPEGWSYRMLETTSIVKPGVLDVGYGQHQGDRTSCVQAAAFHVIDLGSTDDEFHSDSDIPAWLTDPDKRRTVLSNARFRRAYRWANANAPDGVDDDHLWHAWACNHARDERFA